MESTEDLNLSPHFAMTTAGFIVPTVTGLLSTCGSLLILYAIYKSPVQLSTTYHRIMAVMSIFDVLASVCIALTTLPMPSDDSIRYAGPMIGNDLTCQIQGFINLFGFAGGGSMYMSLSWYFVCRMTLMMNPETIRKRIEPFFYLCSVAIAIFLPSYYLSKDYLHATPSDQLCSIGLNHSNCTYNALEDFFDCDLGYTEFLKALNVAIFLIGFNLSMTAIAMIIITCTIAKKSKSIKYIRDKRRERENDNDDANNDDDDNDQGSTLELRYTRVLVVQALMYIFAYFITWIFVVIPVVADLDRKSYNIIQILKSIFFPMQGLWNLIIFIYDKAYLLYQDNEKRSYWQIVKIVLFNPDKVSDIVLPDSLVVIENKYSSREEVSVPINDNNEGLQGVPQSSGVEFSENDIESSMESDSQSETFPNKVIRRNGLVLVEANNKRFYRDSSGFHRTGKVDVRQNVLDDDPGSIESPCGFVSDSKGSILS